MNKENIIGKEDNSVLVFSYIHKRIIYSMSLQKRAGYDVGYVKISFDTDDETLNALSNKEIEKKIKSLKAPCWNERYEYIKKKNKHLLIILYYFPFQTVMCVLYRALKLKQ